MSVFANRVPSSVQPSGGVVTVTSLFAVTKSSRPSVSRTESGMLTRAVRWFQAAWAAARKATVSDEAGGRVGFTVRVVGSEVRPWSSVTTRVIVFEPLVA